MRKKEEEGGGGRREERAECNRMIKRGSWKMTGKKRRRKQRRKRRTESVRGGEKGGQVEEKDMFIPNAREINKGREEKEA